jgi:cell division protein FtsZ
MRLMEVDEAASHIKELVDPDANIIWVSAFNNDLGGKIRVSVVATGIEAEASAQPAPGKVFTFPQRSTAAAAPTPALKTAGAPTQDAEDETPLDLGEDTEGDEELLLDADDILTPPVGAPPIAPPDDEDAGETTAVAGNSAGGTLFERMSNIARGAPKAQIDEEEPGFREPIDIPRFLNRQNNQ